MRRCWSLLSIEKHVDATMPPVFIWHTITDQAVPVENSLLMIHACRDAGVSVEAHLFPQGGHGLSLATVDTARAGSPGEGDLNNVVPAVQDLAAARLRLAPPHVRREVKAAVGGSQAHSRVSRACALAVRRHRAWVIASLCQGTVTVRALTHSDASRKSLFSGSTFRVPSRCVCPRSVTVPAHSDAAEQPIGSNHGRQLGSVHSPAALTPRVPRLRLGVDLRGEMAHFDLPYRRRSAPADR